MTDNVIDDPKDTLDTEVLDLASRLFDWARSGDAGRRGDRAGSRCRPGYPEPSRRPGVLGHLCSAWLARSYDCFRAWS